MSEFAAIESRTFQPDPNALIDNILRKDTPARVHNMELIVGGKAQEAICKKFNLDIGLAEDDPAFKMAGQIAVMRLCGYDYVNARLQNVEMPLKHNVDEDSGIAYAEEHAGPITSWEEFDNYPWPDPNEPSAMFEFEWLSENLPEDMCIVGGLLSHYCELMSFLMGYETLCFALFDNRDLVKAIVEKVTEHFRVLIKRMLSFERVKMVWGSDDMGFKSGTLISPDDIRELVLPGHKEAAQMTHEAGKIYLLHSCGELSKIMDDLIDDVKIDAKHSFEDTIIDVRDMKKTHGHRLALLGGIDMDFLCRAETDDIRKRVRETLDVCMPGGGYCLGTGNSVAKYVPIDSYLTMIDEGMRYSQG